MFLDFLRAYMFSKNASSHVKKMAWLSLAGISIGTFSLILVLSIMSGLNQATELRLLKSEPHVVFKHDSKSTEEVLSDLKNIAYKNFEEFETQDFLVKTSEGQFNGAEGVGYSVENLKTKGSFYDSMGNPMLHDLSDYDKGIDVFLGSDLAFELKVIIGDSLELYKPEGLLKSVTQTDLTDYKSVRVAGILNSESGIKESRAIVYKVRGLFKESKSLQKGWELYLDSPHSADKVKNQLVKLNYLEVETWKDRSSSLFLALKMEKLAMTFLLGLALLITSFSIMTLLILVVVQKQKDIGILLSMGFSKKRIRNLFSAMGAAVSLFGILLGGVLGTLVALIMDLYPLKILPPIYQDPYLPVDFSASTALWVLFFCSLVSVFSSLVPIYYTSNLTPVSALKETAKL